MNKFKESFFNCPKGCWQNCEYSSECLAKAESVQAPAYMTIPEAVDFTGLEKEYLYYLANIGRIHLYRLEKRKKCFKKDDLEKLISEFAEQQKKQMKENNDLPEGEKQ